MTKQLRRQSHCSALWGRCVEARSRAEQTVVLLTDSGSPEKVSLMIDPIGVI